MRCASHRVDRSGEGGKIQMACPGTVSRERSCCHARWLLLELFLFFAESQSSWPRSLKQGSYSSTYACLQAAAAAEGSGVPRPLLRHLIGPVCVFQNEKGRPSDQSSYEATVPVPVPVSERNLTRRRSGSAGNASTYVSFYEQRPTAFMNNDHRGQGQRRPCEVAEWIARPAEKTRHGRGLLCSSQTQSSNWMMPILIAVRVGLGSSIDDCSHASTRRDPTCQPPSSRLRDC